MAAEGATSGQLGKTHSRPAYHQFMDRQHPKNYRRREVNALVQAIRARENRLLLGLPGMGMSNVLRFLVARADLTEREVTFAYLNCDALEEGPDSEAFFETIAAQLDEQGLVEAPNQAEQGYKRLNSLITRIGGDPLRRIVIVVDQGDSMLSAADKSFYRKLKALADLNKRVCYIFAASPRLADWVDPDNLLFAGRRLVVGPLNEGDCAGAIAEEAQRLGQDFDRATAKRLMRLTGGHPGLLRAVSSAVVEETISSAVGSEIEEMEEMEERLNLSDPEAVWVERLLERGDIEYRCQKMWNELDPPKQAALHALAGGRPDSVAADTLTWLQDFGLINEHKGAYKLFSPILTGFAAAQEDFFSSKSVKSVSIVGGKVFRGGEEIKLRPLEQKLLACLITKPGQVYTHDEIAWDVWETAAVTPDMIAGLVSQLRSRLGKGYIRTHYRRGYEFVAEA